MSGTHTDNDKMRVAITVKAESQSATDRIRNTAFPSPGRSIKGSQASEAGGDGFKNKLVFVGNAGAGKTAAIESISDVAPACTRMPAGLGQASAEFTLDYTTIRLDDGELLHVYGVPGQRHLDFMWPMVCDGATGVLVLVNACDPQRLAYTMEMLDEFCRLAPEANFSVGVTHSELVPEFRLGDFRSNLAAQGFSLPVVKVDTRKPAQVGFLLKILLSSRPPGIVLSRV